MPVAGGPKITKTGILLDVDAADTTSYPGSGTTWTNPITPGTYDGTLNNISFDSTDSKGALIFTGSNTYVDFGNIGDLSSAWSFQVAFKPAPTSSGDAYTILSYASGSDTGSLTFKLDYSSSTQEVILSTFSTASATAETVHVISGSANSGSWNIVHGTFGSSLAGLYVNGLGVAYGPTTGSLTGYNVSNQVYAGGTYGTNSGFYTGSMANVTVNNADLGGSDVNKNYNAIASRFGLPVRRPTVTDADAFNFVETAGLSGTEAEAINTLVLGLKSNNLWTKMQAIYPFVGGTAYSHKFNLKDTEVYELSFIGGVTHDSNGVQPNGTNGYAQTSIASTTAGPGDIHLSFYTNQDTAALTTFDRDIVVTSPLQLEMMARRNFDDSVVLIDPVGLRIIRSTEPRSGYRVVSRTATDSTRYYKDGEFIDSKTNNATGAVGTTLRLMTGASTGNYSTRAQQFASFGLGLTDTDVNNLYTLVQAYQTTLGRQV